MVVTSPISISPLPLTSPTRYSGSSATILANELNGAVVLYSTTDASGTYRVAVLNDEKWKEEYTVDGTFSA